MTINVNTKKSIHATPPIENIVAYIKENFKVKDEDKYEESDLVKLIAFEDDDLIYIVDIYQKKPQHLRMYMLFDEPSEVNLVNKVNATSRFAKGTNITQESGEKFCIEIEQMMFGIQTKASAERYVSFAMEYIKKFLSILAEEESVRDEEGA